MKWLVIGGGTAGCVVAARLSENPNNQVVLIEAGPDHGANPVRDDAGPVLDQPELLVPEIAVVRRHGGGPTPYAQGFGLGGSGLVNAALISADPALAEYDHLIPIAPAEPVGPVAGALIAADTRARHTALARRNGCRVTTADAYLRPALQRPNLFVIAASPVVRLVMRRWRVVAAVTADGVEYEADRFVVCAGAINTPALLLRSGVDTPGIGEGLQDHPACSIALRLAPGLVNVASSMIGATIDGVIDAPSGQSRFQMLTLERLPNAPGYGALIVGLMTVASTGRVTVPNPDGPPLVELGQFSAPADVDALTRAMLDAFNVLGREPMQAIVRSAHLDDVGTSIDEIATDPDRVRQWVESNATGFFHASSTCRDGIVTDPYGRVLGYDGLFVCDASVFPRVPDRNPYLSVVQLAERMVRQWRTLDSSR